MKPTRSQRRSEAENFGMAVDAQRKRLLDGQAKDKARAGTGFVSLMHCLLVEAGATE